GGHARAGGGTEVGRASGRADRAKPASCPLASQIGAVEVFSPLLSGAPTIEGAPRLRESSGPARKLKCAPGAWSGSPALSYQWLRGGAPIAEATESEYRLQDRPQAEDQGKALQCQVTAENAAGRSVAVSRNTGALEERSFMRFENPSTMPPRPPASIAAPSGTPSAGNTLTCEAGVWTIEKEKEPVTEPNVWTTENKEGPAFAYQWLRGGAPIAGANEESYALTSADEGKVIQCQVTGTGTVSNLSAIADSAAV